MSDHETSAATNPDTWALLYRRPEPLDAARHGTWRVRRGGADFAANAFCVPLVTGEFVDAGHSYPIVFVGPGHLPMALLGIGGRNRFVKDGAWQPDAYVPAYVRRHPFVFVPVEDRFALAIDAEASSVLKSGTEGEPLFVDGRPSAVVEQAWAFSEAYVREHGTTKEFVKLLEEHRLLVEQSVNITRDGRSSLINGFSVVDATALNALPDALIGTWHRRGYLAVIYAHMASLARFQALTLE